MRRVAAALGVAVCIAPVFWAPSTAYADGKGGLIGLGTASDGVTVQATTTQQKSAPPAHNTGGSNAQGGTSGSSGSGGSRGGSRGGPPSSGTVSQLTSAARDRALASVVLNNPLMGVMGPALMAAMQAPLMVSGSLTSAPSWGGVSSTCSALALTGGAPGLCQPGPRQPAGQAQQAGLPAPPPPPDPAVVARQAILHMALPESRAKIGPDPSINEWKMAAVGYPLWLWTDSPAQQQANVNEQGIELTLDARRVRVEFSMGDGGSKSCTTTRRWSRSVKPGTASPVCGYTYEKPSLPKGKYTVTTTEHWEVTWTALGQTGVVDTDRAGAATQLPVGELQAVNIPG